MIPLLPCWQSLYPRATTAKPASSCINSFSLIATQCHHFLPDRQPAPVLPRPYTNALPQTQPCARSTRRFHLWSSTDKDFRPDGRKNMEGPRLEGRGPVAFFVRSSSSPSPFAFASSEPLSRPRLGSHLRHLSPLPPRHRPGRRFRACSGCVLLAPTAGSPFTPLPAIWFMAWHKFPSPLNLADRLTSSRQRIASPKSSPTSTSTLPAAISAETASKRV